MVYSNPCCISGKANLDRFGAVTIGVGSIPYIFHLRQPAYSCPNNAATTTARVEVHVDSCKGALLATMPLGPAYRKDGVVTLPAAGVKGTGGVRNLSLHRESG